MKYKIELIVKFGDDGDPLSEATIDEAVTNLNVDSDVLPIITYNIINYTRYHD